MLGVNWLLILGGFMVVGWLATHVAHTVQSKPLQYVALVGFVVAEAIIFLPLLAIAMAMQPGIVESAVGVTLLGTAGLTAVAFITRKDFSFLRGILVWGGILALVGIVASVLFGFELGTWFSVAMIGFAGAAVLYDTSNILHHYPEDRYVARRAPAVRVGRADVLVRAAAVHVARLTALLGRLPSTRLLREPRCFWARRVPKRRAERRLNAREASGEGSSSSPCFAAAGSDRIQLQSATPFRQTRDHDHAPIRCT